MADSSIPGDDMRSAAISVSVDPDLCIGSGECVRIAPTAFWLDEDLGISMPQPGAANAERARLIEAVDGCPTQAIRIDGDLGVGP